VRYPLLAIIATFGVWSPPIGVSYCAVCTTTVPPSSSPPPPLSAAHLLYLSIHLSLAQARLFRGWCLLPPPIPSNPLAFVLLNPTAAGSLADPRDLLLPAVLGLLIACCCCDLSTFCSSSLLPIRRLFLLSR
jgi:hypothetical protein